MKIKAPVNTVVVEPITGTERGGIVLPGVSEDLTDLHSRLDPHIESFNIAKVVSHCVSYIHGPHQLPS